MSACNYTLQISPNTCIGDSLFTINQNFSALDTGLCGVPDVRAGTGIKMLTEVTEQLNNNIEVSVSNLFAFGTRFDSKTLISEQEVVVSDGTSTTTTAFPYAASTSGPRPLGAFTTVALSDKAPQVTLYWLASGADSLTVYATNSSVDTTSRGGTWFNGPVTALYRSDNFLYVGGEFTTCGGAECKKFAVLQLGGGTAHPTLSTTGSLYSVPFTNSDTGLGDIGEVRTIQKTTTGGNELLIVGGSYQSASKGKGLTILNTTTSVVYPFFVNGSVNSVQVIGNSLYVGGDFDYILYGNTASSSTTGLRVYTKGLAKIDLTVLLSGSVDASLSRSFAGNVNALFSGSCTINALAGYDLTLYVGGQFQCTGSGTLMSGQNLVSLNEDGTQNSVWQPIVNGPVYALTVDSQTDGGSNVFLYVGGEFSRIFTSSQFYSNRRNNDAGSTYFYNAAAFLLDTGTGSLGVDSTWKPSFNGPVTSFALHDSRSADSFVYCYGTFTEANGDSATHLAAVSKAVANSTSSGPSVFWKAALQTGPSLNNTAILRLDDSIVVGGNFTRLNSEDRYYLARVSGVDESLLAPSLSSVNWDFNAQVVGQGMPFLIKDLTTTTYRITSTPSSFGTVNCTTFPVTQEGFDNVVPGQLCRFIVRRPGNAGALGTLPPSNDTFRQPINVLGWKVDFNG